MINELLWISNTDNNLTITSLTTKPIWALSRQVGWERFNEIYGVNSGMMVVAEYHLVNEGTSATLVITRTNQLV